MKIWVWVRDYRPSEEQDDVRCLWLRAGRYTRSASLLREQKHRRLLCPERFLPLQQVCRRARGGGFHIVCDQENSVGSSNCCVYSGPILEVSFDDLSSGFHEGQRFLAVGVSGDSSDLKATSEKGAGYWSALLSCCSVYCDESSRHLLIN